MARISHLDHLVLTCTDLEATTRFYTTVLQMELQTFGAGRIAFRFGRQKINLHQRGAEFEPKAHLPVPGALDLCLIAAVPLDEVIAHLQRQAGRSWKARCAGRARPARYARCMCAIRT